MNIGIDVRILERKMTGIGRVLTLFLKELPNIDKKNKYFLFSYEEFNIDDSYYKNISTIKSFLPQKLFAPVWSNFILPRYLRKNKINLFFSANQQIPLIKVRGVKYVFVLHDVIYKVNKKFHPFIYRKYLEFFTYFSIKSSDLIITDSKYSKQDILKYYNVNENKIKVIYSAANENFCPLDIPEHEEKVLKEMFGNPEHIILYIGVIENRKNIMGILTIADKIFFENKNIKFLLIGKIGYGGEQLLKEILKRENVIHLMNVDDDFLKKIFNISTVFLFPSFYEGFGFPPLEAMQSGLPVLASENTSLKEIVGSGGIMHHAEDYDSFIKDILRLLSDEEFYLEMQKKGIQQAQKFNIKNTVKEFVDTFNIFEN